MCPLTAGTGAEPVCTTCGSVSIRANTRSPAARPSWNRFQNAAIRASRNHSRRTVSRYRYHSPMVRPPSSARIPPAYTSAAEPSPATVPSSGVKLANTTSWRQPRRNERSFTGANWSYRSCSLRNDLATAIPLMVSCT